MLKYILSDILQHVLNEYIDHTEIEIYNKAFNFKFNIEKYFKIESFFQSAVHFHITINFILITN
jgi:hypothetical protein